MTIRVITRGDGGAGGTQLTVLQLAEALLGLGDPAMPVGIRYDRDGDGDATRPAVSVLLDEDERGTWLVLE